MFYLITLSIHFIFGYIVRDICLRITQKMRQKTLSCHFMDTLLGYQQDILYAPSHRQDSKYLCYASCEALGGTRNGWTPWWTDVTTHRTKEVHVAVMNWTEPRAKGMCVGSANSFMECEPELAVSVWIISIKECTSEMIPIHSPCYGMCLRVHSYHHLG